MAGSRPNLTDPVQLALEVTELKTGLQSLRKEMSQGFENLTRSVDQLQAEARETRSVMSQMARHQAAMEAQSDGLGRAFKAIEHLSAEFGTWRKAHEKSNQDVADEVTEFRGALNGVRWVGGITIVLCGAIVSMVLWIYGNQIQEGKNRDAALQMRQEKDVDAIEKRLKMIESIQRQPYTGVP